MVEAKIGLEIHTYLNLDNKTKLFCNCKISHEAEPNSNACPICAGMPGSKPMLVNEEAIRKTAAAALLLKCRLNERLVFQRKHYSWPDLPGGYQKTMSGTYSFPVGMNGNYLGIGITEIHLEEDPAKWDPITGCVDYNRSGQPLIEIVTEPDFKGPTQVREWMRNLVSALEYIKAVDPDAGIKADVNVSVGPRFDRVEVKNVNSRKAIVKVIEYEIQRQIDDINEGKIIKLQTRAWDEAKQETVFMRSKESAADYMFIPDPDLPATHLKKAYVQKIKDELPERPDEKVEKFVNKIGSEDARVIAANRNLAELFEEASKKVNPSLAAMWIRRELVRVANYNRIKTNKIEVNVEHFIELLNLLEEEKITPRTGQKIIEKLIIEDFSPKEYVEKEGLGAVSGKGEVEKFCKEAIKENASVVEDFKSGNEKALNFIIGQVMRKTKGQATPKEVNDILRKLIQ